MSRLEKVVLAVDNPVYICCNCNCNYNSISGILKEQIHQDTVCLCLI